MPPVTSLRYLPMPRARNPRFSLLNELPVDLQLHLLSFMWTKSVIKSLARTSKYWNHLVDCYVRNRVLYHITKQQRRSALKSGPRHDADEDDTLDRWFNVELLVSVFQLPSWRELLS